MRFIPEAQQIAYEGYAYWETLVEQEDGSVIVSFAAPNLEWAASTALAYGSIVEVLDPPELRQIVKTWAQDIVRTYTTKQK